MIKKQFLKRIQHDLFDIGGECACTPGKLPKMMALIGMAEGLDEMNNQLQPLKEFILPGGSKISSYCHLARTVCRRVERNLFKLAQTDKVNEASLKYINRLSDMLFVLARSLNKINQLNDIFWKKNI